MLPSYTVLPMRVTTPPMSAGSTAVSSCTCLPVARAQTLGSSASTRVLGQRRRRRDVAAHDVRMRQQPLAIDLEQIGQQLEPAASASITSSFASGCCDARSIRDGLHQIDARTSAARRD